MGTKHKRLFRICIEPLLHLRVFSVILFLEMLSLLMLIPGLLAGQAKITLTSSMLYNFSTKGDAAMLIDEQVIANDPASGNGGMPATIFSPGWVNTSIYYPAMVVIDLGKTDSLTSLWVFDSNDIDSISIYTGDPSS